MWRPGLFGFTESTKSTKRTLAIWSSGVDQNACHWTALAWISRIDPFSNRGAGVAAFDGELSNQGVCKSMHQDISDARVSIIGTW